MRPDGVLFDLDGTIWDNTANAAAAWELVLRTVPEQPPIPTREDIRDCCGFALPGLAEHLLPTLPLERAMEIVLECYKHEGPVTRKNGGILYPGIEETLRQICEEQPLFLISNCSPEYLSAFFDAHGLGRYFRDSACCVNENTTKAGNISGICKEYGLRAPVYVGDTIMDYNAATEAGCDFIFAAYGFGQVPQARWRIDSFSDLKTLLPTIDI